MIDLGTDRMGLSRVLLLGYSRRATDEAVVIDAAVDFLTHPPGCLRPSLASIVASVLAGDDNAYRFEQLSFGKYSLTGLP
jgi:hypothetical protein